MLYVSGRKCSCLHNSSEKNFYIYTRVKLWASQNVRNIGVGLCHCRRFSMSTYWETAYVTMGFNTTNKCCSFCYCRLCELAFALVTGLSGGNQRRTSELKSVFKSKFSRSVSPIHQRYSPRLHYPESDLSHWPIFCDCGTRWFTPDHSS